MRAPRPIKPNATEREYNRFLQQYANAYIKLVREGLDELVSPLKKIAGEELPRADAIRMDENIPDRLKKLFEFVNSRLEIIFPNSVLRRWALAMIGGVNKNVKKNTQRTMKKAMSGKTEEIPDFEPLMRDKKLTPYFQNVVDENIALIRSIPKMKMESFKNQLSAMITKDANQKDIATAIQKNFGVTKARASLIARDQVGKLNGKLNQYRQEQLGGTRYRWRGADDARERRDHKRLNGKIFKWSSPPISDRTTGARNHPGEDYQCRCWAEMIMDDITD